MAKDRDTERMLRKAADILKQEEQDAIVKFLEHMDGEYTSYRTSYHHERGTLFSLRSVIEGDLNGHMKSLPQQTLHGMLRFIQNVENMETEKWKLLGGIVKGVHTLSQEALDQYKERSIRVRDKINAIKALAKKDKQEREFMKDSLKIRADRLEESIQLVREHRDMLMRIRGQEKTFEPIIKKIIAYSKQQIKTIETLVDSVRDHLNVLKKEKPPEYSFLLNKVLPALRQVKSSIEDTQKSVEKNLLKEVNDLSKRLAKAIILEDKHKEYLTKARRMAKPA